MLPPDVVSMAAGQDWVVSRQQALSLGLSARQWDRRVGGLLVSLLPGVAFVRLSGGPATPGPRARSRAALLTSRDPLAVLSHGSVLRLAGCQGTPNRDPEHVVVSAAGWHPRAGVQRHVSRLPATDRSSMDGLPSTSLLRALTDCVRSYDRPHAISVLDSALHLSLIQAEELATIGAPLGLKRRGWLALVDRCAESPLETRARLFFGDHGLRCLSQVSVHLAGYGQARLDFLVGENLVVECDGVSVHDAPSARFQDRVREDALRAAGYEVVRITWADLEYRPQETLARIRAALARCG